MTVRSCVTSLALLCALVVSSLAVAEDWPQFLGPNRDGISRETGLAKAWPEGGPKELWSVDLGEGFGGPAIRDGEVFLLDRIVGEKDIVRCFSFRTGEEKWRYEYNVPGRLSYQGSRSTPTVTEDHVYTVGGFGHVHCISRKTHEPVWSTHFEEFGNAGPPNWGYSQSPLLYKDTIIVAPISKSTGLVALNKHNGQVVWKTEGIGGDCYNTPTLVTLNGVQQVVFLSKTQLTSVNPDTGEILWKWGGYQNRIPIPDPTPIGENRLFVTGGYGSGSTIIDVYRDGDTWKIDEVRDLPEYGAQIHRVLPVGDYLYANFNENDNIKKSPRSLVCMNKEGDILWQTESEPFIDRGSLLVADGMILSLAGNDGTLRLIEPSPEGYRELASAKIFDKARGPIWAKMALTDGKLVLRDQRTLKCIDLKNP